MSHQPPMTLQDIVLELFKADVFGTQHLQTAYNQVQSHLRSAVNNADEATLKEQAAHASGMLNSVKTTSDPVRMHVWDTVHAAIKGRLGQMHEHSLGTRATPVAGSIRRAAIYGRL